MSKLTLNANHMSGFLNNDIRQMQMCYRSPANLIDVTGFASINVLWDFDQFSDDNCFVELALRASRDFREGTLAWGRIMGGPGATEGYYNTVIATSGLDVITTLDVSDISALGVFTVDCTLSNRSSANYTSVTVKKIWMEPLPSVRVKRVKDFRVNEIWTT